MKAFAFLSVLLTGCSSMNVHDFEQMTPTFRPEDYFVGETTAWGLFEDRFGQVRRQFQVVVTGVMDGNTLVLDEDFSYSDGEKERRIWRLTRKADGRYEGFADGVVGLAIGEAQGNAFNWNYTFDLNVGDGKTWRVKFNDWMFLQPDGVVINRAWVSRWGFEIGSVTLFFSKDKATTDASASKARRAPDLSILTGDRS